MIDKYRLQPIETINEEKTSINYTIHVNKDFNREKKKKINVEHIET